MKIDGKILQKWNTLYSPGDAAKVIEQMEADNKVGIMTIHRALKKGDCSDVVFEAIATFFNKKEQRIKAVLNEN